MNQTSDSREKLKVSLAFYNLDGTRKFLKEVNAFSMGPQTSVEAMTEGRVPGLSSTYFVRCALRDEKGDLLNDNVYWASATDDDLGDPEKDEQFKTNLAKWAVMSALSTMPKTNVDVSSKVDSKNDQDVATITLTNNSNNVAFFLRAEVTKGLNGEEVLPIIYDDNYVTVFPHEKRSITVTFSKSSLQDQPANLRVEGYNVESKAYGFGKMRK